MKREVSRSLESEKSDGGERRPIFQAFGEVYSRLEHGAEREKLVERTLSSGTDRLFSCASPVGEVYVGASEAGVRLLGRAAFPQEFARRYRERFGKLLSWGTDDSTCSLAISVEAALGGYETEVPSDLSAATRFQRRVLEVVSGIPRGEVRPYAWVAREAGSPRASRAVGSVMAGNPVPLIIPCHRVIRNDGTTGSYAFGAGQKIWLLQSEGVPLAELARSPYLATRPTGTFCHATCPKARSTEPGDRTGFRSADEALEAGYTPCGLCRPVGKLTG